MKHPRRYWSTRVYENPEPPPLGMTQREKDEAWRTAGGVPAPPKIICVECGKGLLRERIAMFKNDGQWYCEEHNVRVS